ncbi:hypothetical protein F5B19DRAFT_468753 [Rostrohypoxylon terebratum]|nr:hypothetical protein F5B19DRAFT_468753 [Rostrohypoxylon terebratum]
MTSSPVTDPQPVRSRQSRDLRSPPRRQVTHYVYTRLSGSIPSNYYDPSTAPFIWQCSDDSSPVGKRRSSAGPSRKETEDRIEEWIERMNFNGTQTYTDPNTIAPSIAGSHHSGASSPCRPTSSMRPPPVSQRSPGQKPVVLFPPGYVPPERLLAQERANQVIISENSERRRRRREERERDRERHR